MISIDVNGRRLSIRFCYSKTYTLDVPDPTWSGRLKAALKKVLQPTKGLTGDALLVVEDQNNHARTEVTAQFKRANPRFMRVQRPLTQCYLEEGSGKSAVVVAKEERRVWFRDKPFDRKSEEMEKFRKLLIKFVLKSAGDKISHDERTALWHAFLTRHTVKPNPIVTPPSSNTPTPASSARGMRSTQQAQAPGNDDPDTVLPEMRIVHVPRPEVGMPPEIAASDHRVVNKIVSFPAGRWNYGGDLSTIPVDEIVH